MVQVLKEGLFLFLVEILEAAQEVVLEETGEVGLQKGVEILRKQGEEPSEELEHFAVFVLLELALKSVIKLKRFVELLCAQLLVYRGKHVFHLEDFGQALVVALQIAASDHVSGYLLVVAD